MKVKSQTLIVECIVALVFVLARPVLAHADLVTYNYHGKPFGIGIAEGGLFDPESFIFGSAVINFTGAGNYVATSWVIGVDTTQGPITITSETPDIELSFADFTLDSSGIITTWSLAAVANVFGTPESFPERIATYWPNLHDSVDRVEINSARFCSSGICWDQMIIEWENSPWTRAAVPEPSSFALLVVGMMAIAGWRLSRAI